MISHLMILLAVMAAGDAQQVRTLAFVDTHSTQTLTIDYRVEGQLVASAGTELNRFLRDYRNDEMIEIDPQLFDLLWRIHQQSGSDQPFHLISGFRSAQTNAMLRNQGRQVAKNSLHVKGQAIDVRLPDVPTATLRKIAMDLKAGGVGYYPNSDFIHVDTGRVRYW